VGEDWSCRREPRGRRPRAGRRPLRTERLGLPQGDLIQPSDLVLTLRFLLSTSAGCEVPEIDFASPAANAFLAGAAFREAGFGAAG
jgi:hypothetical protein